MQPKVTRLVKSIPFPLSRISYRSVERKREKWPKKKKVIHGEKSHKEELAMVIVKPQQSSNRSYEAKRRKTGGHGKDKQLGLESRSRQAEGGSHR